MLQLHMLSTLILYMYHYANILHQPLHIYCALNQHYSPHTNLYYCTKSIQIYYRTINNHTYIYSINCNYFVHIALEIATHNHHWVTDTAQRSAMSQPLCDSIRIIFPNRVELA